MITKLTEDTAQETIRQTDKLIIEAFAPWCSHCTAMRPIFEALEKELGDKYRFTSFDVDQSKKLVSTFNVTSLPTFIFIKNGKEIGRTIGELSREELEQKIEKLLD